MIAYSERLTSQITFGFWSQIMSNMVPNPKNVLKYPKCTSKNHPNHPKNEHPKKAPKTKSTQKITPQKKSHRFVDCLSPEVHDSERRNLGISKKTSPEASS